MKIKRTVHTVQHMTKNPRIKDSKLVLVMFESYVMTTQQSPKLTVASLVKQHNDEFIMKSHLGLRHNLSHLFVHPQCLWNQPKINQLLMWNLLLIIREFTVHVDFGFVHFGLKSFHVFFLSLSHSFTLVKSRYRRTHVGKWYKVYKSIDNSLNN